MKPALKKEQLKENIKMHYEAIESIRNWYQKNIEIIDENDNKETDIHDEEKNLLKEVEANLQKVISTMNALML